jgi:uncharacterized protein Yka (UPF0111/DUF47 family)
MIKIRKKEDKFFLLFKQSTDLLCQATGRLKELMHHDSVLPQDGEELNILENKADAVNTQIVDLLNSTFITPLDREDIYTLAQILDDIVDYTEGTVERMILYRTRKPSVSTRELAIKLYEATEQISIGFNCLNNIHLKKAELLAAMEKIYQIENDGDKLYREELARLFELEKDPIEIIKWKEILEHLETALDHCESTADLLKGVVLKYD